MKKSSVSNQPHDDEISDNETSEVTPKNRWILKGLRWGALMFLFMTILFPLVFGDEITWMRIVIGAVLWTITGLLFGYFNKK